MAANGYFSPIPTKRTFEEAVRQLAEAITSGHVRIGERLPITIRATSDS